MTRVMGLGIAVLLLGAVPASATIRYAAPGGTADDSQCIIATANDTSPTPCSIYEAAGYSDPPGNAVGGADEVVIAPGNYSSTAGDLGPFDSVVPVAGNVHGASGQPRPRITLNEVSFAAFALFTGTELSDVEIHTTGAGTPDAIRVQGGTADRVVAHSDTIAGGHVCSHVTGLIRSTACISEGGASALGINVGTGAVTFQPTLRNVTAVATSGAFAIDYQLQAQMGATATLTLDAKNVIAKGSAPEDIRARATDDTNPASAATVTLNFDYSNYDQTATVSDAPNSSATITGIGALQNQVAAPSLAADNYHQLSTSITINAGVDVALIGADDIDHNAREIPGDDPDIGADEAAEPTTTSVSCAPPSLVLGSGAGTCTGTVTGTTSPTGNVGFASNSPGSFAGGVTCPLAPAGPTSASCSIPYTPAAVATGTHAITATYLADLAHEPSSGSTTLSVTAPPAATPPASTPPVTKKCRKGRKLVRRKGKLRCVKKKRRA